MKRKTRPSMKIKNLSLAVGLGLMSFGALTSCDAIILEDPADLPTTPDEIPRDNPVDPQNNAGNQYQLQLDIEVVTPRDGNVLQGDMLEVRFNPVQDIPSGFSAQLKYAIEYELDSNYIPETEYFDVDPNTTYSIGPFDEGDYTLRYSYRLVGISEAVGDPIAFSVDANVGPGFVFYRKADQTVTNGNPISFELWADDVEDMAGFSINVTSSLDLLNGSVTFQADGITSEGGFFSGLTGDNYVMGGVVAQSASEFTIDFVMFFTGQPVLTRRTGRVGIITITPEAGRTGNVTLSVNADNTSIRSSKNEGVQLGQNGTKTLTVN